MHRLTRLSKAKRWKSSTSALASAFHCDPRDPLLAEHKKSTARTQSKYPLIIVSFLVVQSADPIIGLALDAFLAVPMPTGIEGKNDHAVKRLTGFMFAPYPGTRIIAGAIPCLALHTNLLTRMFP